jgi:replicative superfamily II helicase
MFRAILGFRKRAIYVLPYVSIVSEKCQNLVRICENINLKIIQLHSQSEAVWTPDCDLAICTIEKANSLVNKLIEEQLYFDVSFFVVDEFHLI